MQKFHINISFVQQCVDNGLFTHLAYFVKLKYKYTNGIHYRYQRSTIARKTNHSHSLISKHVKFFLDRGWCRLQHGHLHFCKWKHVMAMERFNAKILTETCTMNTGDTKSIKLALRGLLLDNKLRQQEFVISKRKDLFNPAGRDAKLKMRSAKRFSYKYASIGSVNDETSNRLTASASMLSELFNCSRTTAQRIKKDFQLNGMFAFIRKKTILAYNVCAKAFYSYFYPTYGRCVYLSGDVCIKNEVCTVYRLNS